MKKAHLFAVKFLVCVVLMGILFSRMDLGRFFQILSSVNPVYFVLAFLLLFANTCLSAFKWKLLLEADGVSLSFGFLLRSYLVGTFMNIFLPSSIGGDVFRIVDVARESRSTAKSAASVFIDRASGFFALSSIGFAASLAGVSLLRDPALQMTLLAIFALIFTAFIALFHQGLHRFASACLDRIPVSRLREIFDKLTASFSAYRDRKRLLLKILSISFAFQALVIVIVYLYSRGLLLEARFLWFLIFIPVITVLESIPVTPFALGTRDWGYVFFFTRAGWSMEQAESLAMVYVLMTVLYSLTGGVIFVLRRR